MMHLRFFPRYLSHEDVFESIENLNKEMCAWQLCTKQQYKKYYITSLFVQHITQNTGMYFDFNDLAP